jgi:hypothetical protein
MKERIENKEKNIPFKRSSDFWMNTWTSPDSERELKSTEVSASANSVQRFFENTNTTAGSKFFSFRVWHNLMYEPRF